MIILQAEELNSKYKRTNDENAKEDWTELFNAAATGCMHGVNCALGPGCQVSCWEEKMHTDIINYNNVKVAYSMTRSRYRTAVALTENATLPTSQQYIRIPWMSISYRRCRVQAL